MSDHRARLKHLERRFSERAGARHLDACLDAFHRGDLAALQVQERLELEAGGRIGWLGNMFCAILQPLAADGALIQAEDLERPQ